MFETIKAALDAPGIWTLLVSGVANLGIGGLIGWLLKRKITNRHVDEALTHIERIRDVLGKYDDAPKSVEGVLRLYSRFINKEYIKTDEQAMPSQISDAHHLVLLIDAPALPQQFSVVVMPQEEQVLNPVISPQP